MKINYTAFLKNETIEELFLNQILKSYKECRRGEVKLNPNSIMKMYMQNKLDLDLSSGLVNLKMVVWHYHKDILYKELDIPLTNYM